MFDFLTRGLRLSPKKMDVNTLQNLGSRRSLLQHYTQRSAGNRGEAFSERLPPNPSFLFTNVIPSLASAHKKRSHSVLLAIDHSEVLVYISRSSLHASRFSRAVLDVGEEPSYAKNDWKPKPDNGRLRCFDNKECLFSCWCSM
ncbi:uncharacterized protein ZBAI_05096 [Zygosaccharomyces bailii ISA1307]|nr:uncharacterized protein ZBAI_05096 [Zygosaccharomyces bailii ISA1307]